MTVASVSAVTITLVLVGIFLGFILNATHLASSIEDNVDISVYIDIGTDEKETKQVKTELEKLKHVDKVTFSSKDEQLEKVQDAMGDAWKLFEGDSNPLYDAYVVSADKPENTKAVAAAAEKLSNVFKADYGGENSDRIFKITETIRTWGLGAAILLLFVAVFLISNTIRITILSRQREIQIMRLVGAKNGFIRWPFFLEGAWIGLLGAIIPILIMTFGYQQIYMNFNPQFVQSNYSLLQPDAFIPQVDILLAAVGMVIGSLGSMISMRRFLKI